MNRLDRIKQKIITPAELARLLSMWRMKEKKIVFTNGCFDLIHLGHIDYLSKAADLGDILILGLNSDASVKRLKGDHRPITPQESRAMVLAAFSFVTAVVLFDEDTPIDLIRLVKPDIQVKGGDYLAEQVVGYREVTSHGGEVVILPFLPGFSTSAIEEKISVSRRPGA